MKAIINGIMLVGIILFTVPSHFALPTLGEDNSDILVSPEWSNVGKVPVHRINTEEMEMEMEMKERDNDDGELEFIPLYSDTEEAMLSDEGETGNEECESVLHENQPRFISLDVDSISSDDESSPPSIGNGGENDDMISLPLVGREMGPTTPLHDIVYGDKTVKPKEEIEKGGIDGDKNDELEEGEIEDEGDDASSPPDTVRAPLQTDAFSSSDIKGRSPRGTNASPLITRDRPAKSDRTKRNPQISAKASARGNKRNNGPLTKEKTTSAKKDKDNMTMGWEHPGRSSNRVVVNGDKPKSDSPMTKRRTLANNKRASPLQPENRPKTLNQRNSSDKTAVSPERPRREIVQSNILPNVRPGTKWGVLEFKEAYTFGFVLNSDNTDGFQAVLETGQTLKLTRTSLSVGKDDNGLQILVEEEKGNVSILSFDTAGLDIYYLTVSRVPQLIHDDSLTSFSVIEETIILLTTKGSFFCEDDFTLDDLLTYCDKYAGPKRPMAVFTISEGKIVDEHIVKQYGRVFIRIQPSMGVDNEIFIKGKLRMLAKYAFNCIIFEHELHLLSDADKLEADVSFVKETFKTCASLTVNFNPVLLWNEPGPRRAGTLLAYWDKYRDHLDQHRGLRLKQQLLDDLKRLASAAYFPRLSTCDEATLSKMVERLRFKTLNNSQILIVTGPEEKITMVEQWSNSRNGIYILITLDPTALAIVTNDMWIKVVEEHIMTLGELIVDPSKDLSKYFEEKYPVFYKRLTRLVFLHETYITCDLAPHVSQLEGASKTRRKLLEDLIVKTVCSIRLDLKQSDSGYIVEFAYGYVKMVGELLAQNEAEDKLLSSTTWDDQWSTQDEESYYQTQFGAYYHSYPYDQASLQHSPELLSASCPNMPTPHLQETPGYNRANVLSPRATHVSPQIGGTPNLVIDLREIEEDEESDSEEQSDESYQEDPSKATISTEQQDKEARETMLPQEQQDERDRETTILEEQPDQVQE